MTAISTPSLLSLVPSVETTRQDVNNSFERFCVTAANEAIEQMFGAKIGTYHQAW